MLHTSPNKSRFFITSDCQLTLFFKKWSHRFSKPLLCSCKTDKQCAHSVFSMWHLWLFVRANLRRVRSPPPKQRCLTPLSRVSPVYVDERQKNRYWCRDISLAGVEIPMQRHQRTVESNFIGITDKER